VCTGNICRSPFIERLLQHELDERTRQHQPGGRPGSDAGFLVCSAGTGALVGSAMDPQAAAQLVAHGGDALGFRARDLTPALFAESDLVLTATRAHRGKVALMSPKVLRRVFTFCDFADLVARMEGLSAPVTQTGPRARVREVTAKAAASRGLKPPLPPDLADIADPYRRGDEAFAAMAQRVVESMPAVIRALVG